MIKRIVKMTFQEDKVETFMEIFKDRKEMILASEGCSHLELLQDKNKPTIFFTWSHWESEGDLNVYRHSDLFKNTWAITKKLFAARPEAWSVEVVMEVVL